MATNVADEVVINLTNEELDIIRNSLEFLKDNIQQFNHSRMNWMFSTVSAKTVSAKDVEKLLQDKIR